MTDGAVLGLLVAASLAGCGSSAPATGNPTGATTDTSAPTSAHPSADPSSSAAPEATRNAGTPEAAGVTAPAGAQGAAVLARKLGCTQIETSKPNEESRAVSLAECVLGHNEILIVTFAGSSDLEAALQRLEKSLRTDEDAPEKFIAVRGPNWLAFGAPAGSDRPTRAVAERIADQLGGKIITR